MCSIDFNLLSVVIVWSTSHICGFTKLIITSEVRHLPYYELDYNELGYNKHNYNELLDTGPFCLLLPGLVITGLI
jgi:hypothetical protein